MLKPWPVWPMFDAPKQEKAKLVGGIPTPLKNMSSSVGTILPNIGQVIKVMFQTTNHMRIVTPNKKNAGPADEGLPFAKHQCYQG